METRRISALIDRAGDRFLSRHFTGDEISYCKSKSVSAPHFAGRFAAKEAVFKALRMEWKSGFSWKNIEIHNENPGYPVVSLSKSALEYFKGTGFSSIEISISLTKDYAAASAIVW